VFSSVDTLFAYGLSSSAETAASKGFLAVYDLGEVCLADPENSIKLRHFDSWARAVKTAILKHDLESTFDVRLTDDDRAFAKHMKVRVD
jgi:hypothetical protein